MGKTAKLWLIIAACLVLIGCIIFGGIMNILGWDFSKLSTVQYETNHYEITETFSNISVETNTADIIFALSDDGKCRVECYEAVKEKHSVSVENDTLSIKRISKKAWYDYIGINFRSPKIKISLPKAQYTALSIRGKTGKVELSKDFQFESVEILLSTGDVRVSASASAAMKIKTTTGNILVENAVTGNLGLRVTTGKITVSDVVCGEELSVNVSTGKTDLTNITCKSLHSEGDTGDISLTNVIASEKFQIERDTGDVIFTDSDASEIFVETDTGDVTGSLLSNKIFFAETDTGRVNVPKSTTGGRCQIETDTGDIKITVK